MKTLTQLEPRTALTSATAPGDASSLFVITQPGNYYLTGNLTGVTGKNGISIKTSSVTVDLNGFLLKGVPGSLSGVLLDDGIQADGQIITVKNGCIAGWEAGGINDVFVPNPDAGRFCGESLRVLGNGLANSPPAAANNGGIQVISGDFTGCIVSHNAGAGISATVSRSVESCIVSNNNDTVPAPGMKVSGALVRYCITVGNGLEGISQANAAHECVSADNESGVTAYGMHHLVSYNNSMRSLFCGNIAVVSGCVAMSNAATDRGLLGYDGCRIEDTIALGGALGAIELWADGHITGCLMGNSTSPGADPSNGLKTGINAIISDCSASGNELAGITAGSGSTVTLCHVSANGGGIYLAGSGSRVEGNKVRDNTGSGIFSVGGAGSDNIFNNLSAGNLSNYSPSSGAKFGPLQTPATGLSKWANF